MTTPKIELRTGETVPRTIYRDLVNLPDPVKLSITIRYFNHDDVGLYFQITGSGTGYTFGTENLGLLASGTNRYKNLDEFASRDKPAAETSETITLTLKAYTDAGYSDLKWTFERSVDVVWIKSDDASYTQDELDDFDDGTVQGWAAANVQYAGITSFAVATDYVLSAPYSLKLDFYSDTGGAGPTQAKIYKNFTTPNRDIVYAIIDFRLSHGAGDIWLATLWTKRNSIVLIQLGAARTTADQIPTDKWMRSVVPLPKNTSFNLGLFLLCHRIATPLHAYLWIDDFKIISK